MVTKIRYVRLSVRRSELHTAEITVPAWELPLVEAVHGSRDEGSTAVTVLGDVFVEREAPNAGDEFVRLSNRYKLAKNEDGSPSLPFVAAVYGQFGVGTAALASAIRNATVESSEKDALADLLGDIKISAGG